MIMHLQSPTIVRSLFEHFQGYLGIFSHTHRRATTACFEHQKEYSDLGKKGPDCVHLWVKISSKNVVLRVSTRKNSKMFHCAVSFSWAFDEMFIEVPWFHKPSHLPWKIYGCAPALRYYLLCKRLHLKCLTVFWIRICLDNCLVICTVPLCYVLDLTHSEFRHIQHCLFRYMPTYSIIFSVIKAHSRILRHY